MYQPLVKYSDSVPRISEFYGIVIAMHWELDGQHHAANFHATYAEHTASIGIDPLAVLVARCRHARLDTSWSGPRYISRNYKKTTASAAMGMSVQRSPPHFALRTVRTEDNRILELANEAGASLILSSDDDRQHLSPWRGIALLGPDAVVSRVDAAGRQRR